MGRGSRQHQAALTSASRPFQNPDIDARVGAAEQMALLEQGLHQAKGQPALSLRLAQPVSNPASEMLDRCLLWDGLYELQESDDLDVDQQAQLEQVLTLHALAIVRESESFSATDASRVQRDPSGKLWRAVSLMDRLHRVNAAIATQPADSPHHELLASLAEELSVPSRWDLATAQNYFSGWPVAYVTELTLAETVVSSTVTEWGTKLNRLIVPAAETARDLIDEQIGVRPDAPVVVASNPRWMQRVAGSFQGFYAYGHAVAFVGADNAPVVEGDQRTRVLILHELLHDTFQLANTQRGYDISLNEAAIQVMAEEVGRARSDTVAFVGYPCETVALRELDQGTNVQWLKQLLQTPPSDRWSLLASAMGKPELNESETKEAWQRAVTGAQKHTQAGASGTARTTRRSATTEPAVWSSPASMTLHAKSTPSKMAYSTPRRS
jgi:hypothetical protein